MKPYQNLIAILLTAFVAMPLLANAADDGTSSDTTAAQKNRNESDGGTKGKAMNTDPSGRYKDRKADDTSTSSNNTGSNGTDTTAAPKKNRNETAGTSGKALNTDPSGRYKDRTADETTTTSGASDQK